MSSRPGPDLVLIGLRASGKTSLGRALASRSAVPFVDLDELLADRCGHASAGAALRAVGESAFRDAELLLLRELLDPRRAAPSRPAVIALGGGTPTVPAARHLLRSAARDGLVRIVLLDARPEVMIERIERDAVDRPPLTSLPLADEVRTLAAQRMPSYRELAESVLDTSELEAPAAVLALRSLWLDSLDDEA